MIYFTQTALVVSIIYAVVHGYVDAIEINKYVSKLDKNTMAAAAAGCRRCFDMSVKLGSILNPRK